LRLFSDLVFFVFIAEVDIYGERALKKKEIYWQKAVKINGE
jgi:hypothetical protein